MRIILQWIFVSAGLLGIAYFLPNYLSISPWWMAIIAGAVYMFIQTIIKPILKILTLPATILTLGLFGVALNAILFWALSLVINGFVIYGIAGALVASFIMSIYYWLVKKIFKD